MTGQPGPVQHVFTAEDGYFTGLASPQSFTLAAGHPMRAAACLVCRKAIGGEPASVIAVIGLAGPACSCSEVPCGGYLLHNACQRDRQDEILDAAERALACTCPAPWDN